MLFIKDAFVLRKHPENDTKATGGVFIKRMRMIVSLAAAAALLFSMAAMSVSAEIKYVRGDANGDGTVNINDVTVIQRILADLEQDTKGDVIRSCDLDDNCLDIADATNIQCYLAEFESPYQIGKTFSYDEYELPFIPN